MALGNSKPRNWGKNDQEIALWSIMKRRKVAYKIVNKNNVITLFLTPSNGDITLPFTDSVATLVNERRGLWIARHQFDDRILARGISQRDVIRATIEQVWH